MAAAMEEKATAAPVSGALHLGRVVPLDSVKKVYSMSNEVHIIQEIHDILQSYYKVNRKTFVDSICKQVCGHFLLTGPDESPLNLFSPIFVSLLSVEELEAIAGESPSLKRTRAQLRKEIGSLTEAKKVLAKA